MGWEVPERQCGPALPCSAPRSTTGQAFFVWFSVSWRCSGTCHGGWCELLEAACVQEKVSFSKASQRARGARTHWKSTCYSPNAKIHGGRRLVPAVLECASGREMRGALSVLLRALCAGLWLGAGMGTTYQHLENCPSHDEGLPGKVLSSQHSCLQCCREHLI